MALPRVDCTFGWVGAVVVSWDQLEVNLFLAKEAFQHSRTFVVGDLELWLDAACSDNVIDFLYAVISDVSAQFLRGTARIALAPWTYATMMYWFPRLDWMGKRPVWLVVNFPEGCGIWLLGGPPCWFRRCLVDVEWAPSFW